MQKLMMQCLIKDKRLHVPEYIIPMHLCKVESWFVKKNLSLSVYLHNLTTNIKIVDIKSLINIANYGNDDPQGMSWQVLCQCFSLYSHTCTFGKLKKVFFQLHSDTSLKLAFLAIHYSLPVSIKENTPILLPILALLANRLRFP